MKWVLLILIAGSTFAQEFDLPEVLCFIQGTPVDSTKFASSFCWVGDQNGDGYDDLLTNHDPGYLRNGRLLENRVELFYGGEEMDDEPDALFNPTVEPPEGQIFGFGYRLDYLGYLVADHPPFLVFQSAIARFPWYRSLQNHIDFFEGGDELDDEPEFSLRTEVNDRALSFEIQLCGVSHHTRPTDLNGDGFNDVLADQAINDTTVQLLAYFGGEEFDTIPDWRTIIQPATEINGVSNLVTGYDINGDNYDDIIFFYDIRGRSGLYKIYLGGEDLDTLAAFTFNGGFVDGAGTYGEGFSFLPDVNGDGYDDLGMYWASFGGFSSGYYLFFGGEEFDLEVDVILEGMHGADTGQGDICGGDFNGDGYGDIATGSFRGFMGDGEVQIYFGRRSFPEEMDADIVINGPDDYGEEYEDIGASIGAVGDYNGDGIDDFVVRVSDNHYRPSLVIFAGSRDWVVPENSVSKPIPESFDLSLWSYPNPFNSQTELSFNIPFDGMVAVNVYDIAGRLVESMIDKNMKRGKHSGTVDGSSLSSGIYFVNLTVDTGSQQVSKTVKLLHLP